MKLENGRSGEPEEDVRIGEVTWEALLVAGDHVVEYLKNDIDALSAGQSISRTSVAEYMPRRFLPRYDLEFVGRLRQVAEDVVQKLERGRAEGWPYPYEGFLESVAEEMLFSWLIGLAIDENDPAEQAEELQMLQDLSFEDRDFEWLYSLAHDGVTDDPEISRKAGFANLDFKDWFKPFR